MEYKQIAANESWGGAGEIGVKVLISVERELSKEEISAIQEQAAQIDKNIVRANIELDPGTQREAVEQREKLLACFDQPIFVEEIPNEYNSSSPHPWFIVTTKVGRIKLGWRGRVIKIDWSDSTLNESAWALFQNEDVTKEDFTIHAWGYEKAKEYIAKLMLAK